VARLLLSYQFHRVIKKLNQMANLEANLDCEPIWF
jgi:hypothetical protein